MGTSLKKNLLRAGILIVIVLIVGAFIWVYTNPNYKEYQGLQMRPTWDVSDNINYGTQNVQFAKMVESAGFYTFLHDKGPFTVFVPTDKAYSDLPPSITDNLFQPNNAGTLRQFLLYHIVKGKYLESDFRNNMKLETLEGDTITLNKTANGYWIINGSSYIQTYDIVSKNGVIHMTTAYLKPPGVFQ